MNRTRSISATSVLLSVLLASLVGCAGQRTIAPPQEAPQERAEYVIGQGDQLRIAVWRNDELTVEVPVRTDGMISVPLVDDVQASGLTPLQLKAAIAEKLADYITNPDVTVVVMNMGSKRVFVLGEVARATPVPIIQEMRVTDAISLAGGFSQFADRGDVKIIRREGLEEQEFAFDFDAYVAGRAPGTNLLLQPGDTVIVSD